MHRSTKLSTPRSLSLFETVLNGTFATFETNRPALPQNRLSPLGKQNGYRIAEADVTWEAHTCLPSEWQKRNKITVWTWQLWTNYSVAVTFLNQTVDSPSRSIKKKTQKKITDVWFRTYGTMKLVLIHICLQRRKNPVEVTPRAQRPQETLISSSPLSLQKQPITVLMGYIRVNHYSLSVYAFLK